MAKSGSGKNVPAVMIPAGCSPKRGPLDTVWERSRRPESKSERLRHRICKDCWVRKANACLAVATVRAQTMAEDAEQLSHRKDDFIAMMSHELRTPLNSILGWAHMLGANQLAPDRATHAVAAIERCASHLSRMIDDLLDVSRIIKGTLQLTRQPVDLVAAAEAALDTVRPSAVAKNVQLVLTGSRDNRPVSGDGGRLAQVLVNLLTNAVKFTPEGGRVGVSIEPANHQMVLRVVDTGAGISPTFLPHVFECFRQADGATTDRHTGLGLGLAIVRNLVELHGGTVQAASEGLGRGATFTVCLPIAGKTGLDDVG